MSTLYSVGLSKVLLDDCSPVDLYQELLKFQLFKPQVRASQRGKLVAVVGAQGGVGASSIVASLGELTSERQIKSLL